MNCAFGDCGEAEYARKRAEYRDHRKERMWREFLREEAQIAQNRRALGLPSSPETGAEAVARFNDQWRAYEGKAFPEMVPKVRGERFVAEDHAGIGSTVRPVADPLPIQPGFGSDDVKLSDRYETPAESIKLGHIPGFEGGVPSLPNSTEFPGKTDVPGGNIMLSEGVSDDPGLNDVVDALEARGVRVTNTNVNILAPNGRVLGEVDIVTSNAVLQLKTTSSAQKVIDQVKLRTEPYVTRPVVTFVQNQGKAGDRVVKGAQSKVLITNDIDELADLIR